MLFNKLEKVSNAIWQIYTSSAVGGPCSPLGAPKPTSGFVHGQWRWDHYAEVEVTWSKYGDHGWVQRFDNGSIYFSAGQNAGYPVYGEISDIYEAAGGTGGDYGFPISNPKEEDGRLCQYFEGGPNGGRICVGSSTPAPDNYPDNYPVENPFIGIEEEEINLEPDWGDILTKLHEALKDDDREIAENNWNPLFHIQAMAYFYWGALKGMGQSIVDLINLIKNLFLRFGDQMREILDAISSIFKDTDLLKYMLYEKVDEFAEKDHFGKMEMMGMIIGPFILDILLILLGPGVAKEIGSIADKLKKAISSLGAVAKAAAWGGKIIRIVVNGVKIAVKFAKNGLVKIKELLKAMIDLGVDAFKKVLGKLGISKVQKAYLYIEKVGGMLKPVVQDVDLQGIINELWRPGAKIGGGGTGDAIRYEKITGELIGGKSHIQKGYDRMGQLEKWLTTHPQASTADRALAKETLKDLKDALYSSY